MITLPLQVDTILFHADCPDGFCAAYIVAKHSLHPVYLVPVTYGKPIDWSAVTGQRVAVLDFSWSRDLIIRMYEEA